MKTAKIKPKIYENHRGNQRERILEAAEKLFICDGIDNVSIGAIAGAARIARKTLYEYYANKQEIAWAIMQKFFEERYSNFDPDQIPEGTGFQRVEIFLTGLIGMLETFSEHIRFIAEFNTLYARGGDPSSLRQISSLGNDILIHMIRQGIVDGSIRTDVDPNLLSAALLNLVSGMNSRFSMLGNQISQEYGYPAIELYREICRNFLRGIHSTPLS
jgi:AcrR family transcriptional regulator